MSSPGEALHEWTPRTRLVVLVEDDFVISLIVAAQGCTSVRRAGAGCKYFQHGSCDAPWLSRRWCVLPMVLEDLDACSTPWSKEGDSWWVRPGDCPEPQLVVACSLVNISQSPPMWICCLGGFGGLLVSLGVGRASSPEPVRWSSDSSIAARVRSGRTSGRRPGITLRRLHAFGDCTATGDWATTSTS